MALNLAIFISQIIILFKRIKIAKYASIFVNFVTLYFLYSLHKIESRVLNFVKVYDLTFET